MRLEHRWTAPSRVVMGALVFGLMIWPLAAQQTTGMVRGTVTDPSSAAITGANIELKNSATGVIARQATSEVGQFIFNLVPPGTYEISASQSGFQAYNLTAVVVELNKTTQINLTMQLGATSDSIRVVAEVPRIETASARVATNIERKYVVDLPSSTRSALAMAELAPGVLLTRPDSQVMDIQGTAANVNGLRLSSNVYYLDGSDNTGTFRNTSLQFPNPEAVQEVQVSTANTSAEFGKQPGGVFNVVTKSGTNELHGSGFYFFRNENLDANSWSRNQSGTARPEDNLKQGGGTLGGPIRKNKTFFFGSYMAYRDSAPGFQNSVKFPTAAMAQGDFSAFGSQIYDPGTGAPLSGNRIPTSLLDPVATSLLKSIPTVSSFGDRLAYSFANTTSNNELLGKVDHAFSDRHQLQVSYLRTFGNLKLFDQAGNNIPGWAPEVNDVRQDTVSARHIWTLSPTVVVQSRFAIANHVADRANANQDKDISDFGAKWPLPQQGMKKSLPILGISDGFSGQIGYLSLFKQSNYRLGSTLGWVKGKHNVKVGGEGQRSRVRQLNDMGWNEFDFNGWASSAPAGGAAQGIGTFGYSMADFVMGRASYFGANGLQDYDIYASSYNLFLEDEWRITPRLTVTPGLRYEFYSPPVEKNGRTSAFVPGHHSSLYPNAPLGMAFQGDSGIPNGFFEQDRNNFAPRLGFAYDVRGDGRTAIRGGFGVYYAYNVMNIPMWNAERTPWNPSASGGQTRNLVDPWGTSQTVKYTQPPTPFSSDVSTFNYPPRIDRMISYDNNWQTPYTLQWNITAEHELLKGWAVQAGYIANRGQKLFQKLDGNLPLWSGDASLSNVESRRPISGYGVIESVQSRARSSYDALQFSSDLRRWKGLLMRFTYVNGKAFGVVNEDFGQGGDFPANPLNVDGERAQIAPQQMARVFFVYDLPFLRAGNGVVQKALGNWQVSGSFFGISGKPLDVTLGQDWNYDGRGGDRPNATGPITYTNGSRDARMASFFDPSVFANPAIRNTFGNLGRNAIFGPGQRNADLAVLKNFHFTERRFLQLRVEAYDFLNHNNLSNPNTTRSSSDFTRILSRTGNRTMQIGLRFLF